MDALPTDCPAFSLYGLKFALWGSGWRWHVMALVPITTSRRRWNDWANLGYLILAACVMSSLSLQAHHSLAGVYHMRVKKEVTGTLTESSS